MNASIVRDRGQVLAMALLALAAAPTLTAAETIWTVRGGSTSVFFDDNRLAALGLTVSTLDNEASVAVGGRLTLPVGADSNLVLLTQGGVIEEFSGGEIRHAQAVVFSSAVDDAVLSGFTLRTARDRSPGSFFAATGGAGDETALLELQDIKIGFDRLAGTLLIESDMAISAALADRLGDPAMRGAVVGMLLTSAAADWTGGDEPPVESEYEDGDRAGGTPTECDQPVGPDVIVGEVLDLSNYDSVGGIEAFAVGTTSCNIGDEDLLWIAGTNEHPVIPQNMYQLKDGRFRQVGMSWLKHGFTALTQNACGCGCNGHGGTVLGVGCSDPYCCGLNGSQTRLGPRFEVNAYTGYYEYPYSFQGQTGDTIYKRLQVDISDLDPAQDGGGDYFVEAHYITADDALAGNGLNNASYRQVAVSGGGSAWNISLTSAQTQREQPGIRAWADNDPAVNETDVFVPDEGLFMLAEKATDLGGGVWHYEYAIHNFNSDRSMGSFSVPIPDGATVSNIGFHDVDYHSGEPYDLTDWTASVADGLLTWSTDDYGTNPNANALRWSTLYNFWFDVDAPPASTQVTLGLFKPGEPASVYGIIEGPDNGPQDCNTNGIPDDQDIADGTSADCNGNGIPDECETFATTTLTTIRVASGLNRPVFVTSPPGDLARLFIVEQDGVIKILTAGEVLPTPFLNINSLVGSSGNEQGLLSMAFHPDYDTNGYFYVDYTNNAGNTVIARYSVSGNPNVADPGSALILKTINQDFPNHNGGQLEFGPDGYLYVGMGDGGSGGDPNDRAQDLNSLLGKMLRLDVDGDSPYIPPDNPFAGGGGLPEIWAYGLRNPWRFSFDRQSGDIYIGDVGQNAWEEIDFQPADSAGGENYGWRCYEGDHEFDTTGCDPPSTMVFPILEYSHSGGACSVTGGYVYRGCLMPDLAGTYFYAEYCSDWIRSFRYVNGVVVDEQDRTTELTPDVGFISSISSFGQDAAGELYICDLGGEVFKIVPLGGGSVCGNGIVEFGEECDDGGGEPGDGCDQFCQWEDIDSCEDAVPVCPGEYSGTTADATNDGSASCGSSGTSPDVWYTYRPAADGTLTVDTCGSAFDTVLSIHSGCSGTTANELGCNDDDCGEQSSLSVEVTAGTEYVIRVSGKNGADGPFTLNVSGPNCAMPCNIVLFEDDFEADLGWTVESIDLTDGAWERGDPAGAGTRGDPTDDFHGGGQCYLTANVPGNSDVDGGPTRLLSPVVDLSAGNVYLEYAYWFYWDDGGGNDKLSVEVSVNGTDWVEVALHNDTAVEEWRTNSVLLDDFVTPSDTTQIRFSVDDNPNNSVVEAAVDAVTLSTPCADCNFNGVPDSEDIALGTSLDLNGNGIPDECEAGGNAVLGGKYYDNWWSHLALPEPEGDHPLWELRPDQTSNPSTGSATWRCNECHGWDYKGVDGQYGAGPHRTGFPGVLGTTLTESEMFVLLKEPPSGGDGPGVLNGHDFGSVMSDEDIEDVVAFALLTLIDDDTYIAPDSRFIGDEAQGQINFTTGGSISCTLCHGPDGTWLNFGTPEEPEYLGTVATLNPWKFIHKARFGQPASPMPSWIGDGGQNQGVADIGKYVQLNFPTGIPGDYDYDGDVDLDDFGFFSGCMAGPDATPGEPQCLDVFDADNDNDVDLGDFDDFTIALAGG